MIPLRILLPLPVLLLLLTGCGSDFEWFPKNDTFSNNSTVPVPVTAPGTVMRTIPFPAVVLRASDAVFDRSSASFWLLAGTSSAAPALPNALVQISATTGAVIKALPASGWPLAIGDGSTLALDGSSFWVTGNGQNAGATASQVYLLTPNGATAAYQGTSYACPATSSGFCQGLAWDSTSTSFWSTGSDTARLVNYEVTNGVVTSGATYTNLWTGSGVSDVTYDRTTGEVFVVKGGVIRVKGSSGTVLGTIPFTVPGNGRGDWDGQYLWVVDNTARTMKALFVR